MLIRYHYIVICTLVTMFNWWLSCKGIKLRVFIKEELVVFHWLTFSIIYAHKYYTLYIYMQLYIYILYIYVLYIFIYIYIYVYILYKLHSHFQLAVWPNKISKKASSYFHRTCWIALNPFSIVKLLNFAIAFRKNWNKICRELLKHILY